MLACSRANFFSLLNGTARLIARRAARAGRPRPQRASVPGVPRTGVLTGREEQ